MMSEIEQLKADEKADQQKGWPEYLTITEEETNRYKERLGAKSTHRPRVIEHQESSRSSYRNNGWGWLLLIGLGLMLMGGVQFPNLGLHNWWALFILVPGLKDLGRAMQGKGSLWSGVILTFIALTFLVGLSWSYFLPMLAVTWLASIFGLFPAK